jgi:hypothetical protein
VSSADPFAFETSGTYEWLVHKTQAPDLMPGESYKVTMVPYGGQYSPPAAEIWVAILDSDGTELHSAHEVISPDTDWWPGAIGQAAEKAHSELEFIRHVRQAAENPYFGTFTREA